AYFDFTYKVPAQWTGKVIRRSQPGQQQRFYSLLNALPATPGASIQYMGIQAEDIGANPKTAEQFIAASPLAQTNSAYQSLGLVKTMLIGGHAFARADYKTKPTLDDPNGLATIYQTQLVTVEKNYAITLSFTTDNQSMLDVLANTGRSI